MSGGPALATYTPDPEHQRRLVSWWLRSTIDADEAEAMASHGYRPTPCGNCGRKRCLHCDVDPAERVFGGRAGRRTAYDPSFVRTVVARVSRFPAALVQRLQPAIAALPPDQRMVLLLADGGGWQYPDIALRLKISRQAVSSAHARALSSVTAAVWPPTTKES